MIDLDYIEIKWNIKNKRNTLHCFANLIKIASQCSQFINDVVGQRRNMKLIVSFGMKIILSYIISSIILQNTKISKYKIN